jgi:hypothetical protein
MGATLKGSFLKKFLVFRLTTATGPLLAHSGHP